MAIQGEHLNQRKEKIGSIVIVGGGIAGVQTALDIANSGFKVHLVEEKPSVGGVMAQLDKTFPTNDCSSCMMGPKLVELANHPNIEILAYTDVLDLDGEPGRFQLTLKKKARAVDPDKCVSCGICAEKCPVAVSDPFNLDLNRRKAIYVSYPQAVPLVYTIDKEHCRYFTKGKCRICEKLCENKAILFDQEDEIVRLKTGAVILAGGFEPFDARIRGEYGYGRWPNVVTSLEYERILSGAGPFQGHIQRISDGKIPRRIAWIQCVGSRDTHLGQDYCSAVCCMYATKQAMITREHDIEATIFYIDIRAHGKGFDRFYERSKSDSDVRYVRSMISRVIPNPEDDTLRISYATPEHHIREEIEEEDSTGAPIIVATENDNNTLCLACHATHGDFEAIPVEWVADYDNHIADIGPIVSAHSNHPYDPEGTGASRCSKCHMPKTAKSAVNYDIHSHSFEPIAPEKTKIFEMPSSCAVSCHMDAGLSFGIDFTGTNVGDWTEPEDIALADTLMHWYGPGGMWWDHVVSVEVENSEIPETYALSQNYPNPFNPTTQINFSVPEASIVKVVVYDVVGREVEVLVNEFLEAGNFKTSWNAAGYSTGVYFYRMETSSFVQVKKMILMK